MAEPLPKPKFRAPDRVSPRGVAYLMMMLGFAAIMVVPAIRPPWAAEGLLVSGLASQFVGAGVLLWAEIRRTLNGR